MDKALSEVFREYDHLLAEEQKKRESGSLAVIEGQRDERLLAVGPKTGQFIHLLASSLKEPTILELGTSYGYSTVWLADAARASGGKVITIELADYKSAFAREMAAKAGLAPFIDFRVGDATKMLPQLDESVDFVLLDLWKDLYVPCLSAFVQKLNAGAIVVADNISSRHEHAAGYSRVVRSTPGMSSFSVPVGQGLEVSRFKGL